MGKGSGVFCAMLFSCLLLTGCAENPTEDIVVNKNEGRLEQAIQRENKKDSDTSVPEKYTDQFQADGEKIEVSVDASVTGLEENKPVVRVKPHLITEEEADRIERKYPWVSSPIQGILGTYPIHYKIAGVHTSDGDVESFYNEVQLRGDSCFEVPFENSIKEGTYYIDVNIYNRGYSLVRDSLFIIVVE